MTRALALAAYAVGEVTILAAMGIVVTTGIIVTGRSIEWLLLLRADAAESRQERRA